MIYDEVTIFGRAVSFAARIVPRDAAKQIFAGEDLVRGSSRSVRPGKFGDFDLKGIARPMAFYEAVRDGPR